MIVGRTPEHLPVHLLDGPLGILLVLEAHVKETLESYKQTKNSPIPFERRSITSVNPQVVRETAGRAGSSENAQATQARAPLYGYIDDKDCQRGL